MLPDIVSYLILGVVQGLTEFLPVSSTGHLIIARELLGLNVVEGLSVDAVFHFATAGAVLIYFRRDFLRLLISCYKWISLKPVERGDKVLILALVAGTIPAVIAGLFFEDYIETIFRSVEWVAWALIAGSTLFWIAEYVSKRIASRSALTNEVSVKQGLAIGLFQALALIPGMSRSGSTISGGLLLGISREYAARFAFLLSFPVILGAGSLSLMRLGTSGFLADAWALVLIGGGAAFATGLLAIHYLLKYLKNHTLGIFIVYRIILALLLLWLL